MQIPVSVLILAKNEAANIETTIASVAQFDDVIVVDSGSTDDTVAISEAAGARVVQFDWDGAYPKKKQWSMDNAGAVHEWVLLLDADERPTPELVTEIGELFAGGARAVGAYDIDLLYRFSGRVLRHGHRVTKRSLLSRAQARFPEVDDLDAPGIREVEGHYQPQTQRGIGRLNGTILHDDRDPVSTWFDRHNRYSDWEAHLNLNRAKKRKIAGFRTARGKLFDAAPFKPGAFFAYAYIVRRGFLDGRAGFDYAFALSHYYWQIGLKTRELRRVTRGSTH